jgi:hypothetical protein
MMLCDRNTRRAQSARQFPQTARRYAGSAATVKQRCLATRAAACDLFGTLNRKHAFSLPRCAIGPGALNAVEQSREPSRRGQLERTLLKDLTHASPGG